MGTEVIKNSTSPEIVENAEQVVTTEVKVSTDTSTYDDNGRFVEATYETHKSEVTKVVEVSEDVTSEVTDNATKEDPVVDENASKQDKADEGVVENASTDTQDEEVVENACKEDCACKSDNSCKSENACKTDNATEEVENACNDENTVSVEEFESLKQKCSELENQLAMKNTAYKILMQKCSELETYKNNKENENMKNAVELALNSVSHILSSSQIDEWRKESEKFSAENVDEFTNKLKAFAFDIQEKNGVIPTNSIRNAIPKKIPTNESMDLWERIEKKYN